MRKLRRSDTEALRGVDAVFDAIDQAMHGMLPEDVGPALVIFLAQVACRLGISKRDLVLALDEAYEICAGKNSIAP